MVTQKWLMREEAIALTNWTEAYFNDYVEWLRTEQPQRVNRDEHGREIFFMTLIQTVEVVEESATVRDE